MDKLQEIKEYFSKQNDWNTLTEFEYFKWLIQEIESLRIDANYKEMASSRLKK